MAKTQFTDSAGRIAYKDSSGRVFTEGGKRDTFMNVAEWNKRQAQRWGSRASAPQKQAGIISPIKPVDFGGGASNQIVSQALDAYRQAQQPQIQALQSQIPTIKQSFEAQRGALQQQSSTLQDRYKNLLDQIKGRQTVAENRQTLTTAQELGRRGVLPSSGLGQREITQALNPISTEYNATATNTALQGIQGQQAIQAQLAQLPIEQQQKIQAVQNAIAQLQGNAGANAVNFALQSLQNNAGGAGLGGSGLPTGSTITEPKPITPPTAGNVTDLSRYNSMLDEAFGIAPTAVTVEDLGLPTVLNAPTQTPTLTSPSDGNAIKASVNLGTPPQVQSIQDILNAYPLKEQKTTSLFDRLFGRFLPGGR